MSDGVFTYSYNAAGRPVRAESVTATVVYTYNTDGLRVAQSVDGEMTEFAWDWATGVPEMLSEGGSLYLVGHDTLGKWDGSVWAYYLPDALGSARQAADSTGQAVSSREWTPYGVEMGVAQAGLGYTGKWWDAALGLTYLRARWYASYGFFGVEIQAGAAWAEINDPAHGPESPEYAGPYEGVVDFGPTPWDPSTWNLGDEPLDHKAVTLGIKLWEKYGVLMTYAQFQSELGHYIGGLDRCSPDSGPPGEDVLKAWPGNGFTYPLGYFDNKGASYTPDRCR